MPKISNHFCYKTKAVRKDHLAARIVSKIHLWLPDSLESAIFRGFYPCIYTHDLSPRDFYPNYLETYVQRDVHQLNAVHNLIQFRNFVRLCAGRIGQPVNYQTLASDAGISPVTAKTWLVLLEASHICFLLPPYFKNFSKRISKTPKLFFYDVGFAANLLGITAASDLHSHFARGNLFENLIVAEMVKQQFQSGWQAELYYWQKSNGREIDLLTEKNGQYTIAEIKSASTLNNSFFDNLSYFQKQLDDPGYARPFLIYGGTECQERSAASVRGWYDVQGIF